MRPQVQLVSLFLVIAAFAALLYNSVTTFDATDPKPPVKHDTQLQVKAIPVKVGLTITNIPEFDISDNKFVADLIVWFEFDSAKVPLEVIDKFSFDRGKIDEKSDPFISKNGSMVFARYRLRLTFSSPLDQRMFPLNDHTLYLTLKNEYIEADKFAFIAAQSSFYIEPEAETDVWTVVGKATEAGYFEDRLGEHTTQSLKYPGVVFSIDLAKQGMRKVFLIMLPMLILFILASFSFLLDPKKLASSILGLSTGTLTGLIAYRFVIERVEPNVGYFTFTDHVFNLFLVAIFIIYMVNLFALKKGEDDMTIKAIKGMTLVGLQVFLVVSCFILSR